MGKMAWELVKPVIILFATKAGRNLLELAFSFVMEASRHPEWTSEEKRVWVALRLGEYDFGTGNQFADSVVNFAVEWAVQVLKAKHPKPVAVPSMEAPKEIYFVELVSRPASLLPGDRVYYSAERRRFWIQQVGLGVPVPPTYVLVEQVSF